MSWLSQIDDRWLPGLARRYVLLHDRVARVRSVATSITPHDGRAQVFGKLDRLDARAAKRSWWLPGRAPGVVMVSALMVLVVCIVTLKLKPAPTSQHDTVADTKTPVVGSTYVGPQVGDNVSDYVARRNSELNRLAATVPQGPTLAVLSFSSFTSINQAATLLAGVSSKRVFFGVHVEGMQTDIGQSAVTSFVEDTRTAFASNARARARLSTTFQQFANAITASDPASKRYRQIYDQFAQANRIESEKLGAYCDCVIGAVVDATLGQLADLLKDPSIRIIDVAPSDVPPNSLGFRPISPDETTTIQTGTGNFDQQIVPQP